ncbi:MAG: tail-specific protease [Gammaproteobacteria bacterium]|nr:MAG: tail-specific protease [Gammaproteobacteria bacterium]
MNRDRISPVWPARLLLTLLLTLATLVSARPVVVPQHELVPSNAQRRATQLITHFISNYHYKRTALDDALSSRILDRYLEDMDPNRSYFLDEDVRAFDRYRYRMDDFLRAARLEPAFEIFRVYRVRVEERVSYALQQLEREFDFTRDESYRFDRTEAPWPKDRAELDEIWRQRVKNDVLALRLAGKEPEEITRTLRRRYERMRNNVVQMSPADIYQLYMNAYTRSVEPHTAYFSPRTSENFKIHMSLSLEGIGAVLQGEGEYTVVREVIPGGPAALSKLLHPGDRIIGVGQGDEPVTDVIGWRLDDVVDLIRGPKGKPVVLEVLPKGAGAEGPARTIRLVRDRIRLEEQAAKSEIIEVGEGPGHHRIGVIDIPAFYLDFEAKARGDKDYRSTTRDVRRLLAELEKEGVDGVVIDLRADGGGSLSEAVAMTGLFISHGPVVQIRDYTGRVEVDRDEDPAVAYTGPLAVLVDRNSASASEIFAAAIQDYRRGIVIGEPTYGKGTVQNLIDLDRFVEKEGDALGQLKATVAQFFRINGASTQLRGVVPDILFPTADSVREEGERALDNPLPWAKVEPVAYTPQAAPVDAFARAGELFRQRLSSDEGFRLLLEEQALLDEGKGRTTVSLKEADRRREWEEMRRRQRELTNRLRRYSGLPPLADDEPAPDEELAADDGAPVDEEEESFRDIPLNAAARILADLIDLSLPSGRTLQAGEEKEEPVPSWALLQPRSAANFFGLF